MRKYYIDRQIDTDIVYADIMICTCAFILCTVCGLISMPLQVTLQLESHVRTHAYMHWHTCVSSWMHAIMQACVQTKI